MPTTIHNIQLSSNKPCDYTPTDTHIQNNGNRHTSNEPLDLSISHSREIPNLPQIAEPVEISEARLARIAHENAAQ